MKQNPNFRPSWGFLGWLALLQLASILLGLGVILLFLDLFDDGAEFFAYGWCMLPLWFLWGYRTPRRARPEFKRAAGILALWTALLTALSFLLPDWRMVVATPQLAAGGAMARLWPGSRGSALFLWTVQPAMEAAAHAALPALLALGLFLRRRLETAQKIPTA